MAENFFTQTELNKIVAHRVNRERERMTREFEKKLKRCMASVHLTIYQELCSLQKEINPEWSDAISSKHEEKQRENISNQCAKKKNGG